MPLTFDKSKFIKQKGLSIWVIGLSGAGKTSIAKALEQRLMQQSYFSLVQDADIVRLGLNRGLGYTLEDRKENIRRAAEVSNFLVQNHVISINAFICPTEEIRQLIFSILRRENVFLIYLSTPIEVCEQRDMKGVYAKARKGELKNFTGISADFYKPVDFDIAIDTSKNTIEDCVEFIFKKIEVRIRFN